MTYNEFFRQATLKICGNLNIEESIFLTLQFLEKRMPVTIMFLEYYDVPLSSTRTIAKATPEGGMQVDLLTPLSPQAIKWASGYLEDYKKQAYLYHDPWSRPYASEMMRFHKISLNSVILLPLETGGKVIGSLIVGCEKDEQFSDEHAFDSLYEYNWPGNIRELQNVVEREMILYPAGPLKFSHLQAQRFAGTQNISSQGKSASDKMEDVLADHIRQVLTRTEGRIHGENGAAAILGVNASTLRNKMNKLGIHFRKKDRE
jgi:hypothetical protein